MDTNARADVIFTVDQNALTGKTITNKVAMMNQWDYSRSFLGEKEEGFFKENFPFVENIQFMTATGGSLTRDLFLNPADNTVLDDYDFTKLIEACRNAVKQGIKPFIKTGAVPLKYSTKTPISADFGVNLQKPDDYNVYHNYIAAAAQALTDEFGIDEVRGWKWGVLTEYENQSWFDAGSPDETKEAYFCLYDYTVDALQSVLGDDIYIGAHSMTCADGMWDERDFIRHCANGTNRCTGEHGTRLCYLASSFYDITPNQAASRNMVDSVSILRECAEECGLHNLRYGIDEGRILNGCDNLPLTSRITGHTSQAAYDAMTIKQLIDNDIDYFCAWCYLTGDVFNGLKTVSYHTADRFSKMVRSELLDSSVTCENLPRDDIKPEIVAGYDAITDRIHIMAYHFVRDMMYSEKIQTRISVSMPEFEGQVRVTRWIVDDSANFFEKWYETAKDKPNNTGWSVDSAQIILPFEPREYEKYSHLVPTVEAYELKDGKIDIDIDLQCGGVVFYTIEKIREKMDIRVRAEAMRAFFDEKIDTYDGIHSRFLDTKLKLTEALKKYYPSDAKLKILDLGGGTGLELIALYDYFPNAETTVLDISPKMLEKCAERPFAEKLTLLCGDYYDTDWGNGYDAVISTSSLHHYDEKNKTILYEKILNALKPGGVFVNSDKTADNLEAQEEALRILLEEPGRYRHNDTPLCVEREVAVMEAAGFSDITVEPTPQDNYKLYTGFRK